jgi:hypothetical protein
MERQYKDICSRYKCKAKVFARCTKNLENQIGTPDLLVVFTNPVAHEMVNIAKKTAAARDIALVQSHNGSSQTLVNILEQVGA